MSNESKRMHRVSWLLGRVQSAAMNGYIWGEEKLISEACIEFGAGRRYIKEILKDLVNTKRIVIEFGEVFSKQAYEAQKIIDKNIVNEEELNLENKQ